MKKLLTERFQELAGIKPLYISEAGFDNRFDDAMDKAGFSGEEKDDIMSRDSGSPFPGDDIETSKASKLIDRIKLTYKNMSSDEMESFSKEMVEYFLDQSIAAQAAAKVFFGKREL